MITISQYDCDNCEKRDPVSCTDCRKTGLQIISNTYTTGHNFGFPYKIVIYHPESEMTAYYDFNRVTSTLDKNNMVIYISQPRENVDSLDFENETNEIIHELDERYGKAHTYYVHSRSPEFALIDLGNALHGLTGCKYAYFAPGWENDKACQIEHDICVNFGIKILKD